MDAINNNRNWCHPYLVQCIIHIPFWSLPCRIRVTHLVMAWMEMVCLPQFTDTQRVESLKSFQLASAYICWHTSRELSPPFSHPPQDKSNDIKEFAGKCVVLRIKWTVCWSQVHSLTLIAGWHFCRYTMECLCLPKSCSACILIVIPQSLLSVVLYLANFCLISSPSE